MTKGKRGKRKAGRPAGSKNKKRDEVIVEKSTCPRCGSTRRENYRDKKSKAIGGKRHGRAYNRVTWRPTRCLKCGQARIDKMFEFIEPPGGQTGRR